MCAVLTLQAAIITQGDQRVRGGDVECRLAGKNRKPEEFSVPHQSAIEPAKVIGAAAQPKLRMENVVFSFDTDGCNRNKFSSER
jgi:hypothetical protein